MNQISRIKSALKIYKDFPKQGIDFVDILNIFTEPELLELTVDLFVNLLKNENINTIVGLEARGFLLGPIIALKLKCKFAPIRKKGKLPGKCFRQLYALEYGEDCIEIQETSTKPGDNVAIIDDLLATGGTMEAAISLINKTGAKVVKAITLIELDSLKGREKLNASFHSFIHL